MALPTDAEARRFYRAAYLRPEDGRLMLEQLDRPNAAIYLAGYAVECILKALILANTPVTQRSQSETLFRTGQSHDFERLQKTVETLGVKFPRPQVHDFRLLEVWSVDLRYDPRPGARQDAVRFLQATQRRVNWASERM